MSKHPTVFALTAKGLGFVIASVLVAIAGFVATRGFLRGPVFPEFTATVRHDILDSDGKVRFSQVYIYAQKEDGSTAEVYPSDPRRGASVVVSRVVDLRAGTHTTLTRGPEAVTVTPLSQVEFDTAIHRKTACKSVGLERKSMLDVTVLKVAHQDGNRLIEQWQAPALSCFPLSATLSRVNNGVVSTQITSTAIALEVVAPDSKYFRKDF